MLNKNLAAMRLVTNGNTWRRLLATTAGCETKPTKLTGQLQVTRMPSGLTGASIDSDSPLARVAVLARAGARYESSSSLGMSHLIRSAAGLATEQYSSFGITRNIEYHGGRLSVTGTRDTITYLLEAHNDDQIVTR